MKTPNFFVAGAPKCGSTALYSYLRQHPAVYIPNLKEPRYFAFDLDKFREIYKLEDYEKIYQSAPANATAIGDCSPWYLCSDVAIQAIKDFNPEARIIVIVRNPIDAFPSLYTQFVNSFKELELDIERAWNLQTERAAGEHIPPHSPAPKLLQYGSITKYGEQLERLLNIFPHKQVKIILFEDFIRETRQTYVETLNFLELEDDGRLDFPIVNERKKLKNKYIAWTFASPSSPVYRSIEVIRSITGVRSTNILGRLLNLNRKPENKNVLRPEFRQHLATYYRSDIQLLSRIINRNLDHWLED